MSKVDEIKSVVVQCIQTTISTLTASFATEVKLHL